MNLGDMLSWLKLNTERNKSAFKTFGQGSTKKFMGTW